jgi:hypothetical protein
MKSSTKGLFVILLIVMSFVAVPAVFALSGEENPGYGNNNDPGPPEPVDICTNEAEGCVTYVAYRTIVINGVTTFKTPISFNYPEIDDKVLIKYWVNPDGVKVACAIAFIGTCD